MKGTRNQAFQEVARVKGQVRCAKAATKRRNKKLSGIKGKHAEAVKFIKAKHSAHVAKIGKGQTTTKIAIFVAGGLVGFLLAVLMVAVS